MWAVCVLALHQSDHSAAGLDASGAESHPAQGSGVDPHGTECSGFSVA